MTIAAGTRLGRYEIRSKIGAGGMGEVYLAQDRELDRKVALKILPAEVATRRDRMERARNDAGPLRDRNRALRGDGKVAAGSGGGNPLARRYPAVLPAAFAATGRVAPRFRVQPLGIESLAALSSSA